MHESIQVKSDIFSLSLIKVLLVWFENTKQPIINRIQVCFNGFLLKTHKNKALSLIRDNRNVPDRSRVRQGPDKFSEAVNHSVLFVIKRESQIAPLEFHLMKP